MKQTYHSCRYGILAGLVALGCTGILLPLQGCSPEPSEKTSVTPVVHAVAEPSVDAANADITSSRQNAITRVVAMASPAIVGINVTEVREYNVQDPWSDFFGGDPFFQRFWGRRGPQTYKQEVHGLGSGFLISSDGYILTNDHVAGNAKKVIVTMTDGEKYDAKIIGSDRVADVALLKIEGKKFPYVKLGNSDDVIVGEWSIAFGNPFGLFDKNAKPTVTVGVVSNTGVSFTQDERVYRDMIQTDAAISSGNSGGPLLNAAGEVIGMNTVIFSTAQSGRGAGSIGIGFSVPINRVKAIVEMLRAGEELDRNFTTGMAVRGIDDALANALNLDRSDGVIISDVYRNSPAAKAGLEAGDIILDIDGHRVVNEDDVLVVVNDGVVGQKLDFTVLRGTQKLKKTLTLERRQ